MLVRAALIVLTGVLFWLPSVVGQPFADRPNDPAFRALADLKVGVQATYARAWDAHALHQAIASSTQAPAATLARHTANRWRVVRTLAPKRRPMRTGVDVLAADDVPERLTGWDQEWIGRLALLLEVHAMYQRAVHWQTSDYQLKLDPMSLGWTLQVPLRKEDSSEL